jgi:uncharacterized protein YdcH (DUF465 family)
LYSFYACLAAIVAIKAGASLRYRILTPFLVILVLPFMNYAALKFGEAGMDVLKYVAGEFFRILDQAEFRGRSLRPLVVALVPGQQRLLDQLKAKRLHLSNEVAELINEYGPKMYQNFDEVSNARFHPGNLAVNCFLRDSGVSWFRPLACHHPVELPVSGVGRVDQERLMLKAACLFIPW